MATPLFKPTIDEALDQFLETQRAKLSPHEQETLRDLLEHFRGYLNQEGPATLTDEQRFRWENIPAPRGPFIQIFHTPQLLRNVPGYMQDISYQQALLPRGTMVNTERMLHALARYLLLAELATERDYLGAIEALPTYSAQLEDAEQLVSILFDYSRDEPPVGKVSFDYRGYLEITRVRRGHLTLIPLGNADLAPQVRVPLEASDLAQVGWWIEAHLIQCTGGWQFIDIENVLP